ncbi:SOS response-associated peptidase [Methylobrevis albus]|uniref:Abasic site processing protein n=1 Tax=Methylobrevis albus TaxID=2793297 RepID=A0A931MYZ8_9HYPH|nr:SOS response-associated peptidase [Methylobrevis albus]MBH0238510.1 SOS response-associated peptidase [Methylobrevis albus]
MCGRLLLAHPPAEIRALFGYEDQPNLPPRYNIAPTQPLGIVHRDGERRRFLLVRWSFIPSWTKDPGAQPLLINARAETAADKATFRAAMRHRRGLVPASGFYEWLRVGKEKRPFLFRRRDGAPFALGALYETYLDPNGSEIDTAAILTTSANALMARIHDRMPVIIPPERFGDWLDTVANQPKDIADLLGPAPDDLLEAVPVSMRVNGVRDDDAGLIEPISEPLTAADDAPGAPPPPPAQGSLF